MELTKQCIEEIMLAAPREVDNGTLTITIQVRPEDGRYFDMKLSYTALGMKITSSGRYKNIGKQLKVFRNKGTRFFLMLSLRP